MQDKFDGPDLYSTIVSLASEIIDMSQTLQSKIYSEKVSVKIDVDKFKRNTEVELNARTSQNGLTCSNR